MMCARDRVDGFRDPVDDVRTLFSACDTPSSG
jgi:hypothetical protein